jgi:hypothetical protein
LLFGTLLVLLALLASWLMRACAPVDAVLSVATHEAPVPPAPEPPTDPTPGLKASFDQAAAEGKGLAAELAELQAELKRKQTECLRVAPPPQPPPKQQQQQQPPPPPLPADRWARKDIAILEGCWVLGRPVTVTRGDLGSPAREVNCTRTAGRICFGSNGAGQHEATTTCPIAGTFSCSAPIRARFEDDGTLRTTQPRVQCSDVVTHWLPYEHTCRRVNDNLAVCRSNSFPGFPSNELEFRRAP